MININEIKPYALNAKIHGDKQLERLAKIINRVGWRQPILVSARTKEIIVGHGRFATWNKYKETYNLADIWAITDTGETISGTAETKPMSEEEEKMYRHADNAVAQLAEYDVEIAKVDLRSLNAELLDMACFDQALFADVDLSKKNKEIEPGSIQKDATLIVPFSDYTQYLECLEIINDIKEESGLESDAEVIHRALSRM